MKIAHFLFDLFVAKLPRIKLLLEFWSNKNHSKINQGSKQKISWAKKTIKKDHKINIIATNVLWVQLIADKKVAKNQDLCSILSLKTFKSKTSSPNSANKNLKLITKSKELN